MTHPQICALIPTYNNGQTLAQVIDAVLERLPSVIVVNDGSTDDTGDILKKYSGKIEVVDYEKNRGKGYALSRGFDRAQHLGYTHAITIDSDGQHHAGDIPLFAAAACENPDTLVIGNRNLTHDNMPKKSTFANRFSNFWFTVQTARRLPDTQTGFRLYPLQIMKRMRPVTSRYEAELELLVRCAWRRIEIRAIPIQVFYAPKGEQMTHFRPGIDFVRISVLNTVFVLLAVVYGYPSMAIRYLLSKNG